MNKEKRDAIIVIIFFIFYILFWIWIYDTKDLEREPYYDDTKEYDYGKKLYEIDQGIETNRYESQELKWKDNMPKTEDELEDWLEEQEEDEYILDP